MNFGNAICFYQNKKKFKKTNLKPLMLRFCMFID